jgi:hypothetical protein
MGRRPTWQSIIAKFRSKPMSSMVKINQAPMRLVPVRGWLRCLTALADALSNNLEQSR